MRVRYIYSACVVIETDEVSILCDPWFTDGAYDGSWYQYPKIANPLDVIGRTDIIYVSHIHPDHYDPEFLRQYLDRYPGVRIFIPDQDPPFLRRKMQMDGFAPEVIGKIDVADAQIAIVPNKGTLAGIDSALAVCSGGHAVINMNDNPFNQAQIDEILSFCSGSSIEVALLPHSGAGPYPQTFEFDSDAALQQAVETKRQKSLQLFQRYLAALAPRSAIPFAGQYHLIGALAAFNDTRGVTDALEAVELAPGRSLVLADGGAAYYDTKTAKASATRTQRYSAAEVAAYLSKAPFPGYAYEREIKFLNGRSVPFVPLLDAAVRSARRRFQPTEKYWLCFKPTGQRQYICVDIASSDAPVEMTDIAGLEPRCEITIDNRYFFGLLTRLYHWNNAEVGSHYKSRRVPDTYRPEVYRFLDRLHV